VDCKCVFSGPPTPRSMAVILQAPARRPPPIHCTLHDGCSKTWRVWEKYPTCNLYSPYQKSIMFRTQKFLVKFLLSLKDVFYLNKCRHYRLIHNSMQVVPSLF
jgi:hypothetical protein